MKWTTLCLALMLPCVLTSIVPGTGSDACQPITMETCTSLGYSRTRLPNVLGHSSEQEAALGLQAFLPVLQYGCSQYLVLFLCSAYFPRCEETVSQATGPCRSLCQSVRDDCQPVQGEFGYPWPEALNCSRFPDSGASQQCVDLPSTPARRTDPSTTAAAPRCEAIQVSMCSDMAYNSTLLPNPLGHADQQTASIALHALQPLIQSQCSAYLKFFLCTIYLPVCTVLMLPILPCRNLCQSVRDDCLPTLQGLGFEWPASLQCSSFQNGGLCIGLPSSSQSSTVPIPTTTPTTTPTTVFPAERCEPIEMGMCLNIGYNFTSMPNLVGHTDQQNADMEIRQFFPLVEVQCSEHLKLFLCAAYAPVCVREVNSPIGPCKGLCESARDGCLPLMQKFGFEWPAKLKCSSFPNAGLCVDIPSSSQASTVTMPTTKTTTTFPAERCEPIEMEMCRDIGYNFTSMPNLLGHTNQRDAGVELRQNFYPLVKVQCSEHLRRFVCAAYAPVCVPAVSPSIGPCRELCESARNGCQQLMERYSYGWPETLNCSSFPPSKGREHCVNLLGQY